MKATAGERVFNIVNIAFMAAFSLSILLPLVNIFALSFNNGYNLSGVYFWPKQFSLSAYDTIITKGNLPHSALNSAARTVFGTLITLVTTSILAYILSERDLVFRRGIIFFCIFTMYVGGGLIPEFLLFRAIGFYDNFLIYIIPGAISAYYLMIMRQFFEDLPQSVMESARIDGAGEMRVLWKIILPMSLPIIATIAVMSAVGQWTYWQDTYFFTRNDGRLETLQSKLVGILLQAEASAMTTDQIGLNYEDKRKLATPETIRMATIVVTTLPIIMVYPLLQRYFISGIRIGAVKE
jgi:putative aldouronate transport system permease protein